MRHTAPVPVPVPDSPVKSKSVTSALRAEDAAFDEFWKNYPRKVGKKAARKAWITATREASPAFIIHAVRHYPFDLSDNKKFVPYPAKWLNEGRYEDWNAHEVSEAQRERDREHEAHVAAIIAEDEAAARSEDDE